jgi:carbonic anhydrase
MISAIEAVDRLVDGNQRFISDLPDSGSATRHLPISDEPSPFAIILGCSDSRVPTEYVFNQGIGDLFVVRVAGNVVSPQLLGSIEYAAQCYGTKLVVVLGHTQCGAVLAALDKLQKPNVKHSHGVQSLVNSICPAINNIACSSLPHDEVIQHSVRANIRASVRQLRSTSETLRQREQCNGLTILGAEYSLESGQVDFFDGVS